MGWAFVSLAVVVIVALAVRDPRRLSIGFLGATALVLAAGLVGGPVGAVAPATASLLLLGVASVLNGAARLRRRDRSRSGLASLVFGLVALAHVAVTAWFWMSDRGVDDSRSDVLRPLFIGGLPLMFLAFVFVSFVAYGLLYGWAAGRWSGPVDAVIVLGAGLNGARVSPQLAARLQRARLVWERSRSHGKDAHFICSGGQGPDELVPEAVAMAEHLVQAGVDRDLVWLEDTSTSTHENIRLSAAVADEHGLRSGRFAVVTNDYHVLRAAVLMRAEDLDGHAVGARTAPRVWVIAVLREFAAIVWEHRWLNGAALVLSSLPFVLVLLLGRVG